MNNKRDNVLGRADFDPYRQISEENYWKSLDSVREHYTKPANPKAKRFHHRIDRDKGIIRISGFRYFLERLKRVITFSLRTNRAQEALLQHSALILLAGGVHREKFADEEKRAHYITPLKACQNPHIQELATSIEKIYETNISSLEKKQRLEAMHALLENKITETVKKVRIGAFDRVTLPKKGDYFYGKTYLDMIDEITAKHKKTRLTNAERQQILYYYDTCFQATQKPEHFLNARRHWETLQETPCFKNMTEHLRQASVTAMDNYFDRKGSEMSAQQQQIAKEAFNEKRYDAAFNAATIGKECLAGTVFEHEEGQKKLDAIIAATTILDETLNQGDTVPIEKKIEQVQNIMGDNNINNEDLANKLIDDTIGTGKKETIYTTIEHCDDAVLTQERIHRIADLLKNLTEPCANSKTLVDIDLTLNIYRRLLKVRDANFAELHTQISNSIQALNSKLDSLNDTKDDLGYASVAAGLFALLPEEKQKNLESHAPFTALVDQAVARSLMSEQRWEEFVDRVKKIAVPEISVPLMKEALPQLDFANLNHAVAAQYAIESVDHLLSNGKKDQACELLLTFSETQLTEAETNANLKKFNDFENPFLVQVFDTLKKDKANDAVMNFDPRLLLFANKITDKNKQIKICEAFSIKINALEAPQAIQLLEIRKEFYQVAGLQDNVNYNVNTSKFDEIYYPKLFETGEITLDSFSNFLKAADNYLSNKSLIEDDDVRKTKVSTFLNGWITHVEKERNREAQTDFFTQWTGSQPSIPLVLLLSEQLTDPSKKADLIILCWEKALKADYRAVTQSFNAAWTFEKNPEQKTQFLTTAIDLVNKKTWTEEKLNTILESLKGLILQGNDSTAFEKWVEMILAKKPKPTDQKTSQFYFLKQLLQNTLTLQQGIKNPSWKSRYAQMMANTIPNNPPFARSQDKVVLKTNAILQRKELFTLFSSKTPVGVIGDLAIHYFVTDQTQELSDLVNPLDKPTVDSLTKEIEKNWKEGETWSVEQKGLKAGLRGLFGKSQKTTENKNQALIDKIKSLKPQS